MNIVLIGASGFLGRNLLVRLTSHGHRCAVLTRNAARRQDLGVIEGVRLVQADVFDGDALGRAFEGAGAVISMAGILNEKGRNGKGFHRVHVSLVERIIDAAQNRQVARILHVSALNAGSGPSHYLRTKGEAEQRLLASGLDVSLFRPSVIFGRGDSFFNRFAALLHITPVLPLACPQARLQPVWVDDVARAMLRVLENPDAPGSLYELGGPRDYTLRELVQFTARQLGVRRAIIGLPNWASALQGRVMDFVPGKPFSTDNYRSLQTDNVTQDNALPRLHIQPASIEAIVPDYLRTAPRQARLNRYRRREGID